MAMKLKPCPFCGGEAKLEDMGFPHHVYCTNCGARVTGRGFGEDGEADAIRKWNQRAEKEQTKQRFFASADGKITPLPIVVRCKDCRYYEPTPAKDEPDRGWCNGRCSDLPAVHGDWFCADGEKKA